MWFLYQAADIYVSNSISGMPLLKVVWRNSYAVKGQRSLEKQTAVPQSGGYVLYDEIQ